jgi:hypothetical protein
MIYELDDDPTWKKSISYEVVNNKYENLHIEEVIDKSTIK